MNSDSRATTYSYRGARAMVLLHEEYLRSCLRTWKLGKEAGILLPVTDDPDYESMESLLRHILGAARGYMVWMCEKLELPDPTIDPVPNLDKIAELGESYLEHLLERWRTPLRDVSVERFGIPTYPSRWGVDYCIDAMLEHAVRHPIRHEFQLKELIRVRGEES
ncbi:MAG: hypothetical protein KDD67_13165 [Ignavibacteriae bacterium]|nr:hypothetical protein [Ignavibacteriota bacterium]MCB9214427.1 hypothetical protein [Ignavibacteria bacterium]